VVVRRVVEPLRLGATLHLISRMVGYRHRTSHSQAANCARAESLAARPQELVSGTDRRMRRCTLGQFEALYRSRRIKDTSQ
jgi:hypothetical protein